MTERELDQIKKAFEDMPPEKREEVLAEIIYENDVNQDNVGDHVADMIGNAVAEENQTGERE